MKTLATSLLLLFLTSARLFAQHGSNAYRDLADSLYRHHHYQYAADYYEKALRKSNERGYLMLQIAKSYDKINNPVKAEQWFDKAGKNRATFADEDYYLYAEALVVLKKMAKADSLLTKMLGENPNAHLARRALSDIRNFEKFFADSARYKTVRLAINSDVAEFSPAYYKDGIVFSAAKQEGALKKKYHWDNSHFLNLYYSSKNGESFNEPKLFEKDLNTKHHDGPAIFYSNFQKMILNRNQNIKVEGREDVYEWRPGLYDASYDASKDSWMITPLPFNETAYSFSHPYISEDGNTLYFSSDKPGGYGGMDLYKVGRVNGTWSTPFNLGPSINTEEDEAFPFIAKNTLYFASNGHGGLGGLDIFTSDFSTNGFTPPVNLGYPVNSSSDDFSLITDSVKVNGYYASSRSGNDDIFSFVKHDLKINLLAHIFDGESDKPLAGANIQVITNGGEDMNLVADDSGNFKFAVPEGIAFIVIGSNDDMIGMTSDIADSSKQLNIAAYRDTTVTPVVVLIKDEIGLPRKASHITITDLTTGEQIPYPLNQSIISFQGREGHNYNVAVADDFGNKAEQLVTIGKDEKGVKRSTLILPTNLKMEMAGRVFRADDNNPIAGATVRIMTFGDEDQELKTNAEGIVEFTVGRGTAYVVIATKDGMSGMHSGMAEDGMGKANLIHPIPVYSDLPNAVLAMGLVTSKGGEPVLDYEAEITNKLTGEKIALHANKGILTFLGEKGKSYNINITHHDFENTLQELFIPADGSDPEKFAIIMEEKNGIKKNIAPQSNTIAERSKPPTLLVLETEEGNTRAFIASEKSLKEITEKNGELYIQEDSGNTQLGKGTIDELKKNPTTMLASKGINISSSEMLRNIYFDFDKSTLDAEDEGRLQQVKQVLNHRNNYSLMIGGHADDRGQENYNMRLSRRRSAAVSKYLVSQGIPQSRVILKAFGESHPVIDCPKDDCSEKDHQLNRRVEFVLSSNGKTTPDLISNGDNEVVRNVPEDEFQSMLARFGDKEIEGISFRINIGAFKRNHALTFPELADLGKIESIKVNGITFYTLNEFMTLKKAEEVRKKVLERGIKGASISIYRMGDKINLSQLSTLAQ
ncbi:MAG: OmpA family protein [Chryseolinea sp.]